MLSIAQISFGLDYEVTTLCKHVLFLFSCVDDIASELKHMDITGKMLSEVKRRFSDRPVGFSTVLGLKSKPGKYLLIIPC